MVNMVKVELAYKDFLKLAWKDRGKPKDAPLYRDIYINLVAANIFKLKGELPGKDIPINEIRIEDLEKRVKALEEG